MSTPDPVPDDRREPIAPRSPARLAAVCAGVLALFWLYHLVLTDWLFRTGSHLGAVHAGRVPPLHARWETGWPSPWGVLAVVLLALFLWAFRRLFLQGEVPAARLLPLAMGLFMAIGLSVSMIDGWQCRAGRCLPAFLMPYSRDSLEYLADVPKVEVLGPRWFVQRYARPGFFSRLALHSKTHPPGGVLFLWLVGRWLGPGLEAAAFATIAFAALTVPLLYGLGRELFDGAVARLAVGLFLLAPNFVMYATTSMDGPFAVLPLAALWLFARALRTRSGRLAALSGAALAAGTLMNYGTVFAGVFCVVLVAVSGRDSWRAAARLLVPSVGGFAGLHLVFVLAMGFDLPAAIRASMSQDRTLMGGPRVEGLLHYLNVSVANLAAFLVSVGVPLVVLWIGQAIESPRSDPHRRPARAFALALLLTVAVMAFSTLFTLEVERVWLFMTPLVALAAALPLADATPAHARGRLAWWAAGLTALQLVVFEAVLRTDW